MPTEHLKQMHHESRKFPVVVGQRCYLLPDPVCDFGIHKQDVKV